MRRRNFMIGALLAAFAARASAATPAAPRRPAVFEPAVPAASWRSGPLGEAMLDQLSRRKYVEGDNLKVEIYGTEDGSSGLEALARRVVATKPDIIFVGGVGGPFVQRMTGTIPTVVLSSDLVGQGLVESMAHPGGNITGVSVDTGPLLWGKRIELLREMVPSMTKLAFLSLSSSSLGGAQCRSRRSRRRPLLKASPSSSSRSTFGRPNPPTARRSRALGHRARTHSSSAKTPRRTCTRLCSPS